MPDAQQAVFDLFATEFTFQETHETAEKFAAGLLAAGLKPSDRVAVWGPNQPEWFIMKWATAKLGMPLGTGLKLFSILIFLVLEVCWVKPENGNKGQHGFERLSRF